MTRRDLLIEIGTEEIPARFLPPARTHLATTVAEALKEWQVPAGSVWTGGTPRRLVLIARAVPTKQEDYIETITGPPWDRAFDADGAATKAGAGFARSQGVDPSDLERIETDRGVMAGVRRQRRGRPTADRLREALPGWIDSIPFGKNMRWEPSGFRFARPLRWLLVLFGDEALEIEVAGVRSGTISEGHRFDGGRFEPTDADAYLEGARAERVEVEPAERRATIVAEGNAATAAEHLSVDWDEALLDEVVDLVEWPLALLGGFDSDFLELPDIVLEAPMKDHQRYFPVRDEAGELANRFLVVANRPADPKGLIREGNERVLAARLADAKFYWDVDRRQSLEAHGEALRTITWQEGLGTLDDLRKRVTGLANRLVGDDMAARAAVERAGRLYLADLGTEMVDEFAKLEGEIGALYAERDGEEPAVVTAIREAYMPRGAEDTLPESTPGIALALAHRIDLVVGNLLVGHEVKGNQDPFGMRRAANGVFRMLLEKGHSGGELEGFSNDHLEHSYRRQGGVAVPDDAAERIERFWRRRLEAYLATELDAPADVIEAVVASTGAAPLEAWSRIGAIVDRFRDEQARERFLDTYKRLRNIARETPPLRDAGRSRLKEWPDADTAEFAAEVHRLDDEILGPQPQGQQAALGADLNTAREEAAHTLEELAGLEDAAHRLFEEVRINAEDPNVAAQRQQLIATTRAVFDRFAVFDRMIGGGS